MQPYLVAILWIASILLSMFFAAWATSAYVTRDMMTTTTSSSSSPVGSRALMQEDDDEEEEGGGGPPLLRRVDEHDHIRALWASRIPPGERNVTWLI